MELISPGLGLIFWMTLSFAILVIILAKYAWKPITKALSEREDLIQDSLDEAKKARKEMEKLKFDNEQLLNEAKDERDKILRDARHAGDKIIEKAKEKANQEANRIVESATERIENEKIAAMTDLKNQLGALSIEIAEKILSQELSKDKKQKKYIQKLLDEIKFN